MATYGRHQQIIINDEIELMRDQLRRDIFDGSEGPTKIKVSSISGTIDPYTEEVDYHTNSSWVNVSGIVGVITQKDEFFGLGGEMKVGDVTVLYHWNSISGVFLTHQIREVEILVPGISGLYQVTGHAVQSLAGMPMTVRVSLSLDR